MKIYMRAFIVCVLCNFPAISAHACISEILEPAESVKNLLSVEDLSSLSLMEQRIVLVFERDYEYFNKTLDGCSNMGLSEQQGDVNQEIRHLIVEKWKLELELMDTEGLANE